MAFLHKLPSRPACVFTAIPKRFRDAIERQLAGSVAFTSCSIHELESTVAMQGATMAVVGVTDNSMTVAERLSHGERDVQVYLAHFKERFEAPKNGFAGVFDLRLESDLLAATLRRNVPHYTRITDGTAACPPLRRRQLSRFLEMQKGLANHEMLCSFILMNLLEVAKADEGVFLVPKDNNYKKFAVTATSNEESGVGDEILICTKILRDLAEHEGAVRVDESYCTSDYVSLIRFTIALPIKSRGVLRACILLDHYCPSIDLSELLEGTAFLLEQFEKKKLKAAHDKILNTARRFVSGSWILTDDRYRILHREGANATLISTKTSFIIEPRLRALVSEAMQGEKGVAITKGLVVHSHSLKTDTGHFCLIEIGNRSIAENDSKFPVVNRAQIGALLKLAAQDNPKISDLLNVLLENLNSSATHTRKDLKEKMRHTDIKLDYNPHPVWAELEPKIYLILAIARHLASAPLNATFALLADAWVLSVEIPENALQQSSIEWAHNSLLEMALMFAHINEATIQSCNFGFQVRVKTE